MKKFNETNGFHNAPMLYQDLIQTSKKKNSSIKYKINFKLLSDGVHPINELSKLWLLKFYKLARRYCYEALFLYAENENKQTKTEILCLDMQIQYTCK